MAIINTEIGYKHIREKILSGGFATGMPLLTRDLAKEIGISRTPVRDALRQLESEGLVTIRSRLGATVRRMDLKEFKELCELRQGLEAFASGLAASNRTLADLDEIRGQLEGMRAIIKMMQKAGNDQTHNDELIREDIGFHHAIVSASKNELLKNEILRLRLVSRVVSKSIIDPNPPSHYTGLESRLTDFKDHQRVYKAIAEQNVAAAKEAMERALQNAVDRSIRLLALAKRAQLHGQYGLSGNGESAPRARRGRKARA